MKFDFINEISSLFYIMSLLTVYMWKTDAFQVDGAWVTHDSSWASTRETEHWLPSTLIKESWALLYSKFIQQIFPSKFSVADRSIAMGHSDVLNSATELDPWCWKALDMGCWIKKTSGHYSVRWECLR